MTLVVLVFAISCSAETDDEELDRKINTAVAVALNPLHPTSRAVYEPEAAAYRVALPDESGLNSRFADYAILWKILADIGDVDDGQESFIAYVREQKDIGFPLSREGARVLRRLQAEANAQDGLRHRTHPSNPDDVQEICTLFELALRTTTSGLLASRLGPQMCGDTVHKWEEDQITGADSRSLLERLESLLD